MEITIPLETVAVVCGGVGLVGYLLHYTMTRGQSYADQEIEAYTMRIHQRLRDMSNDYDRRFDEVYSSINEVHDRVDRLVDEVHSKENSEVSQLNG